MAAPSLTHWGRVTQICVSKLTIIGSDNGLSPSRRQAIIWTNAGILLIGPLGTNFCEILIEIQTFSLKKMRLKISSAKCCPLRLGLNMLIHSSPKVMAVFLFLIFENFLIGGMFSILETIKTDRSTLILQNKNWCQMINSMCTTFQMWQNCILQNQVCFERLISLSKTPYIFVKISKPRNWDPYSISAMSHGNRTSSYENSGP